MKEDNEMNIAILTFIYADNFGALLQAYALERYIQNQGHHVEFLDYTPEKEKAFYSLSYRNVHSAKDIIKKFISNFERIDSSGVFNSFRKKYFKIAPYERGIENSSLLIVGSDQVWNEKIVDDLNPYLFSNYNPSGRIISYAASMGKTAISEKSKKTFSRGLKRFSGISVREKNSEDILKSLGFSCCITVVDPVFLLDKSEWINFASAPIQKYLKKRYVLVYLLRSDENIIVKANHYAKDNGLKLYYIHPMGKKSRKLSGKRIKSVGPEEFVWLINNAAIVFTNSFHAVSFCCILGKQFYHVQREDLGNRVSSLLSTVEIKISDSGETTGFLGDKFNHLVNVSKQYLDKYINNTEE